MLASRFLALVIATAISMTFGMSARAADWYTGAPGDGPPLPKAPRATLDIALDGTSQSAFSAAIIGTIAPFKPMDRSGFRLRTSAIVGSYVYDSTDVGRVNGNLTGGAILMGYEWIFKRATIAVYLGGEIVNNAISPNDPKNQAKGTSVGVKVATDFYVTPTKDTMIAGVLSYSSNFSSYYGRLKFGMAFADRLYLGPEVAALGDNFFQQWRVGAHVTGIRFGMLQFGAALGFLNDRVRGGGVYGTVDTRVTF